MSGLITVESIFTTAETGLATAEAGVATEGTVAATAEAGRASLEAVSMLDVEIFEGVPLWLILLIVSSVIFVVLVILLISWIFHAEKEAKKKVHHAPSTHDVMVELQKELLRSMEATSRQNRLMIWLTILFITVSILGGAVVLNFFQNIKNFSASWIAQFIEYINSLFMQ